MIADYAVDRERWARMSIFEQMGNIYSEVGRTFKAKQHHDQERYDRALTRALDLFDATALALVEKRSPKTKEVLRAKEVFLDACQSKGSNGERDIDRYFMQFAIAARLSR